MAKAKRMVHFDVMSPAQFTKRTEYYLGDKAAKEVENFWTWTANAFLRYMETGDVSHLNNLVAGSLNVGRYRAYVRVGKALACHEFDNDNRQYTGKIDKDKKAKLVQTDGNGIPVWESMLLKHIEKETSFGKVTPKRDWSLDNAVVTLLRKASENGKSIDDVVAAIKAAA